MTKLTAPTQTEPKHHASPGAIIASNALIMTLAGWVLKAGNFVYFVAVARLLGDQDYGRYMAAAAIVGIIGVLLELGLTQWAERTIAQDRSRAGELLGNLVALRLALAAVGLVIVPAVAILAGYEQGIVVAVALITGTFIPSAILAPLTAIITSAERYDLSAPLQVAGQLTGIIFGLVALLAGLGLPGLLLAGYIALPAQIFLTLRAIRRHSLGPLELRINPRSWPAMALAALPFGLTSLALIFNFNADTVILSRFASTAEVGWYNAAYGLVFKLVAVADGLLLTMTVSLARVQASDPAAVRMWVAGTSRGLMVVALPATVGLSVLAQPVTTLLYGPSFAPAGPLLTLIAWDIPLLLFTAFCGNISAAIGRERLAARIYLLSAGLNIALNAALIPPFGARAAAAVTLLTDTLTALLFVILLRDQLGLARLTRTVLVAAGASTLMAGGVIALISFPLPVPIITGMVAYISLALAFGLIRTDELTGLLRRMTQRPSQPTLPHRCTTDIPPPS